MMERAMIPTVDEAIDLLKERGFDNHLIEHARKVAEIAAELGEKADRNGIAVEMEILIIGALLHDIGRSETHSIEHGFLGAQMLRDEGVDERIARIAERHVGAGLEEAQGFPYDLFPETVEEKLVCWADKITFGEERVEAEMAMKRLKEELGENHSGYLRAVELKREIEKMIKEGQTPLEL